MNETKNIYMYYAYVLDKAIEKNFSLGRKPVTHARFDIMVDKELYVIIHSSRK